MELREEIAQELLNILEELENYTSDAPETVATILGSLQEIDEIIHHLLENTTKGTQLHQRIVYLSEMLDMANETVKGGGVLDGLWFGKTVINFLLSGTSVNSAPIAVALAS